MKTLRSRFFLFVFALLTLAPLQAFAAADINVVQAWDGAGVPSGTYFVWPNVGAGVPESRRFRIDNLGDATLTISNASSLVSGGCFSQIETPTSSLAPRTSTYFRVRVFCSAPGDYFGAVSIASNDPDENPYVINMQVKIVGPEIGVFHAWDGVEQADGSQFSYGVVQTGTPVSYRFEIRNTGLADLTISNPTGIVSGTGFSLIETPASIVPAGSSTFFRVRFLSSTAGDYLGYVTINNNDADENPYNIVLAARAQVTLP